MNWTVLFVACILILGLGMGGRRCKPMTFLAVAGFLTLLYIGVDTYTMFL